MFAYVLRRLGQSVLVLLGVSVIVFGLLHLTGDPTRLLLPLEAREEDVRQLRALLGLDDPLWVQYVRFVSRAVRGDFGLSFKHQVPALTLIFQTLPATLQLTAAGLGLALLVAVLAQDYVRTARAAGIRAFVVTYKYALKNAAIPLVTIIGLEFGILLGGAVITETIFAWPGVGRLAVDAIFSRDYPLVQAIVAMLATLFVAINLLVDLVYTWLDPRIVYVRATR